MKPASAMSFAARMSGQRGVAALTGERPGIAAVTARAALPSSWRLVIIAISGPRSWHEVQRPRDVLPSAIAQRCRSLRVLRGAIGVRQLLFVLRRQLRRLDRDRQLGHLAGQRERDLIIPVI